jgi:hypothetical protein
MTLKVNEKLLEVAGLVIISVLLVYTLTMKNIPLNTGPPLTIGGMTADLGSLNLYPCDIYPAVNIYHGNSSYSKIIIKPNSTYKIPSNFTFLNRWSFTKYDSNKYVVSTTNYSNDTVTGTGAFTSNNYRNQIIGNYPIQEGDKVIFSVLIDTSADSGGGIDLREGVGVGTDLSSIDRKLGEASNAYSIGFYRNGDILSNSIVLGSNYSQFVEGDIVDVAVDRVSNLIWYRVNGQSWQG